MSTATRSALRLVVASTVLAMSSLLPQAASDHGVGATDVVYDAFDDFSHTSNPTPGGIWSYGYTVGLGGILHLYTSNWKDPYGLSVWSQGPIDPNVIKNETGSYVLGKCSIVFPDAGFLHSHPGPACEFSVG